MNKVALIVTSLLFAGSAHATAIPGVYRWDVPAFDAQQTAKEYLAAKYQVDEKAVTIGSFTMPDAEHPNASVVAIAAVGSDTCTVALDRAADLDGIFARLVKRSMFVVKTADCSPA